jgi:hypothetical protein
MWRCIFEVRALEQAESSALAREEKFNRTKQAIIYSYQKMPAQNFWRLTNPA